MTKQKVYRYKNSDKTVGSVRVLKEGTDFKEYLKKLADKDQSAIKVRVPSEKTLNRWAYDSIVDAVDGCSVEPDGICEHGFPSWLRVIGVI